jgi:hypothetical protein
MDPPFFPPFLSSRPEAGDDLDVVCQLDQTDSAAAAAATIAGLDLSDPIPASMGAAAGLGPSYVTPTAPLPVAADTVMSFTAGGGGAPSTTTRLARHPLSNRQDDGRAKKRARIAASPEFEFESVDYWLKFEEEEMEDNNVRQLDETRPTGPLASSSPSRRASDMSSYNRYVLFFQQLYSLMVRPYWDTTLGAFLNVQCSSTSPPHHTSYFLPYH